MHTTRRPTLAYSSTISALLISSGICSALYAPAALGFDIDSGNSDVKIRWDNTVKYSNAFRLKQPIAELTSNVNGDEGDRNFDKGLISNRVDLFSEFDVTYQGFGVRVTGAAWYDRAYNRSNDNTSPGTANDVSHAYNEFSTAARKVHGRRAEILDAFVFGSGDIGGVPVSFRLGQYSMLYGETLFFGNNGIAGTMGGVDIVKVLSVPGSQFKEIARPDKQVSMQFAVNAAVSVGAYYKFSWEANRFAVTGSYLSNDDVLFGGERVLLPLPNGRFAYLERSADYAPKDSGQGGVQVKWHPGELDLGFYATRYHERAPSTYGLVGREANPAVGKLGVYRLAYQQDVTAYGVSASQSFGEIVLNGEVSTRRGTSLVSARPIVVPAGIDANNTSAPRYAVGNTAHANFSFIWGMGPNALAPEASLLGEVAWNRRLSITHNPGALLNTAERDAWGLRLSYTPTYRQVIGGLDIAVPTTVSYFPHGRSSAFNGFGVDKGGDVGIGVEATYLDGWKAALNLTHFYGDEKLQPGNTLAQQFKDRDFLAFSIRRTF